MRTTARPGQTTEVTPGLRSQRRGARLVADSTTIYFNAEDRGLRCRSSRVAAAGGTPRVADPDDLQRRIGAQRATARRSSWRAAACRRRPSSSPSAGRRRGTTRPDAAQHRAARRARSARAPSTSRSPAPAAPRSTRCCSARRRSTPSKKYPVVMLLHGGPQTQFGDTLELPLERADVRRARATSS